MRRCRCSVLSSRGLCGRTISDVRRKVQSKDRQLECFPLSSGHTFSSKRDTISSSRVAEVLIFSMFEEYVQLMQQYLFCQDTWKGRMRMEARAASETGFGY